MSVISSGFDVKEFVLELRSVNVLRPVRCPKCGCSAYDGSRVVIYGHGKRARGFEGRTTLEGTPESGTLQIRRFRCTACRAVITVLPQDLACGHQYLQTTIALVVALWGLAAHSLSSLRKDWSAQRVLGWAAQRDWPMVRRWALRLHHRITGTMSREARQVAAVVGQHVQSYIGPEFASGELAVRVWEGARRCLV